MNPEIRRFLGFLQYQSYYGGGVQQFCLRGGPTVSYNWFRGKIKLPVMIHSTALKVLFNNFALKFLTGQRWLISLGLHFFFFKATVIISLH